jgi:D-aminopeptidase
LVAPASFTLGVLVQANHGTRSDLLIRGVPVGHELPLSEIPSYRDSHRKSSILIIIATDAPLLPHQLKRLARRATLGLARTGTIGNNTSGDLFLAFSTARTPSPLTGEGRGQGASNVVSRSPDRDDAFPSSPSTSSGLAWPLTPGPWIDPLFAATVEATEEAIVNALLAAETLRGRDRHTAFALPHDRLQEIMRKYIRHGASAE